MSRTEGLSRGAIGGIVVAFLMGLVALALAYPVQRLVGQMFEADGQLDEATYYYRSWTKKHPADKDARWHLASLLLSNARPDAAVAELEAMYRDWPDDRDILEKLVEIEDSLLRVDEVVPRLEELTRAYPDNVELRQRLTDHYRWFGRKKELEDSLKKLVIMSGDAMARTELVEILFGQERYKELIDIFEQYLHTFDNPQHARYVLYDAYIRTGNPEKANEHLRQLRAFDPDNHDYLELEINLLRGQKKYAEAKELLISEAKGALPGSKKMVAIEDAAETLAYDFFKTGENKHAIELQRFLVSRKPTDMERRFVLAEMHGSKKSDQIAVDELTDLLAISPNNINVILALGERLSWIGRHQEATSMYKKALENNPTDENRRRVVDQLASQGNTMEALKVARVLSTNNLAQDRVRLIRLLADSGQQAEALILAEALFKSSPTKIHRDLLGKLQKNELGETGYDCGTRLKTLRKNVSDDPDDARSWYEIYDCAKLVGDELLVSDARKNLIRLQGEGAFE